MKERGILLPIFSLPSKYGIGDFGYEAYEFIDILSENNIEYWEILPINACDKLPYSPISYYALNEYYISLDKLKDMELIKNIEYKEKKSRITYDGFKFRYYKEAYNNFNKTEEYYRFKENVKIMQYSEYMSKKTKEEQEYYVFLQYILDKQWNELKKYANYKGIRIIGDMPIYPAFDSCEVKYDEKYFELENGKMVYMGGTPPDHFDKDGQKWGTPTYNVEKIKEDKYLYLLNRYKEYLKRFDTIRIDHFRGYDSFFRIPVNGTGKEGYYVEGVSYGFFDELFKITTPERFIIEDLGDIREETIKLRNYYNFTRQKILQESIDLDRLIDTETDIENMVIYPGNHDWHTIIGWYKKMKFKHRIDLRRFLSKNKCNFLNVNKGLIEYCLKSKARIFIIAAQDVLNLDDSSRINLPGVEKTENWSWEMIDFNEFRKKVKILNKSKELITKE